MATKEGQGLNCPNCGYIGSKVTHTVHHKVKVVQPSTKVVTMTRRRRVCLNCGSTFSSREFVESDNSSVGSGSPVAPTIPENPQVGSGPIIKILPLIDVEPKVPPQMPKDRNSMPKEPNPIVKKLPKNPFLGG